MFELIKPGTQIDVVKYRFHFLGLSVACILITLALFFTKGLNYGIDFTGGAEIQVKVPQNWDTGHVRDSMEKGGLKGFRVQEIGLGADAGQGSKQYLIKAQGDEASLNRLSAQVQEIISKELKPGDYEMMRVDVVGPAAGKSLQVKGFLSMFYALVCILIYVTIRFNARFSPGAVLALFHDTVITIGVLIICQIQFDLQILAAILALIGYSNNDTIIVFDRIRETTHQFPNLSIEEAVNRAVGETLGRTLLTSLCTLLSVLALYFFGGTVIKDFAFTLVCGIIVGTYSSVFIASSLVITLTHFSKDREGKGTGQKKRKYTVRPEPKFSA